MGAQLSREDQGNDDRPPAEAQVHVVDEDGGAVGAGRRRVHQEARGSMDARARHARHSNYDWEEGLLGDGGKRWLHSLPRRSVESSDKEWSTNRSEEQEVQSL